MPDRVPGKKGRLFSRPSALLVDDRPLRIELPSPPAIHLTMPLAMGKTQPDEEEASPPEPPDEPVEGPARLFIGAPRAVAPTGVRPFGNTTGVDEAAPDPAAAPDDWEERLRWTGLDRSARTRVEDVDGRRDRERQERSRSRTQPASWEALAQPPAPRSGTPPVAPEVYATEPTVSAPRPTSPTPPPPTPRPGGAASRAAAADARANRGEKRAEPPEPPAAPRLPLTASNPSRADEDFFTSPDPTRGGARPAGRAEPARRADPPTTPPSGRFVPRNQRPSIPRVGSSPVMWFVAGLLLIGGALGVVWWRIRGDLDVQPSPSPPAVAVVEPDVSAAVSPVAEVPVPDASMPPAIADPPVAPPPEPVAPPAEPVAALPEPVVVAPSLPPVEPPPVKPPPVVVPPPPVVLVQPLATPKPPKTNPIPKETGVLLVTAHEPVRVRVDGKVIGDRSTKHSIELPIGEHKVVLTAGGRTQPFTVRVDESRPTQIEFKSK
ncbi:hypothetical protein LBMAG42_52880 [Deltaproteobacteria bacterium]|nr:hypothetical protein LBMAG42_52880 [Deltaproteobacteria bacterium]